MSARRYDGPDFAAPQTRGARSLLPQDAPRRARERRW